MVADRGESPVHGDEAIWTRLRPLATAGCCRDGIRAREQVDLQENLLLQPMRAGLR